MEGLLAEHNAALLQLQQRLAESTAEYSSLTAALNSPLTELREVALSACQSDEGDSKQKAREREEQEGEGEGEGEGECESISPSPSTPPTPSETVCVFLFCCFYSHLSI